MNVLIIEDDPMIAKSLSLALTDEGHHSNICGTAEEGYIAARDHFRDGSSSYDAIILDINLPDGDGIKLSKTLRSKKISTPVLVVSGRTSITDKVVALRSGADGYLTKPFDRQELAEKANNRNYIHTIWGQGYALRDQPVLLN